MLLERDARELGRQAQIGSSAYNPPPSFVYEEPAKRLFYSEPRSADDWRPQATTKITEMLHLKPRWDGMFAPAIDWQDVANAHAFTTGLDPQTTRKPVVAPSTNGGVILAWEDADDLLEFVFEYGSVQITFSPADDSWDFVVDIEDLPMDAIDAVEAQMSLR